MASETPVAEVFSDAAVAKDLICKVGLRLKLRSGEYSS